MPHGEGVTGAPAGTVVPQELLEEMLWFFRVEDGKWRGTGDLLATQYPRLRERTLNSVFFPPRKQKKLPREKPTPEVLTEAGTKDDNNLNILRETLLSEKLNLAEVDIELKERSMPAVFLPDPRESES
uniref:SLC51 subunit beta n=1 Tax=Myotis lucifugus TaxID=59463 RepID=G1PUL3_MYOLU